MRLASTGGHPALIAEPGTGRKQVPPRGKTDEDGQMRRIVAAGCLGLVLAGATGAAVSAPLTMMPVRLLDTSGEVRGALDAALGL